METKVQIDQHWKHGTATHIVTDLTDDGEVGYRVDGVPFVRNDRGEVMPQRHWTKVENFIKERTLVEQ